MPDGGFEHFVRPYQLPGSHGSTIIPSTPTGTREKAILTWGATGTMPDIVPWSSGFQVVCCGEGLKEHERTSETVRITQPGKPENYVDVARAKNVKLQKRSKNACGGSLQTEQNDFWGALFADMDAAFRPLGTSDKDGSHNCNVQWELSNVV